MPRLCSSLLLSLLIASPASAVTIDWVAVGNPGNAPDTEVMNDASTRNQLEQAMTIVPRRAGHPVLRDY